MAQEPIVQELVTRFRAETDEASFKKAAQQSKTEEAELQIFLKESKKKGADGLAATLAFERKEHEKHFNTLRTLVKNYYEEQLKNAGDDVEKRIKVTQMMNNELKKVDTNAAKDSQLFGKENLQQVDQGYQKIIATGKNLISTFAPGLIGIMGVTGFLKALDDGNKKLLEMQFLVKRMQFSAGETNAGFGARFVGGAQGIRMETGMSLEQIGKLGMGYAREGIGLQGSELSDMTRGAIGLGTAHGVGPEVVVDAERKFARLGVDAGSLHDKFNSLSNAAKEAKTPIEEYIGNIIQLTEQNRMYGATVDESAALVWKFKEELKAGTITLSQLSSLQHGGATLGRGTQAFLGGQLLSGGYLQGSMQTDFAQFANNPIAMARFFKGTAEGKNANQLTQAVGNYALDQANQISGANGLTGNAREMVQLEMIDKFFKKYLNIDLVTNEQARKVKEMVEKGDIAGLGAAIPHKGRDTATAIDEGMKALTDSMTVWQKLGMDLELVFLRLASDLQILFATTIGGKKTVDFALQQGSALNIPYMGYIQLAEQEKKRELTADEKKMKSFYGSVAGVAEAVGYTRPELTGGRGRTALPEGSALDQMIFGALESSALGQFANKRFAKQDWSAGVQGKDYETLPGVGITVKLVGGVPDWSELEQSFKEVASKEFIKQAKIEWEKSHRTGKKGNP